MRCIIAGSRTITNYAALERIMKMVESMGWPPITEIVSGGAKGVDSLGERWAVEHNLPIKRFEARWIEYGRGAGPIRNKQMAEYANAESRGACVALWDGKSSGTKHMNSIAMALGMFTCLWEVAEEERAEKVEQAGI